MGAISLPSGRVNWSFEMRDPDDGLTIVNSQVVVQCFGTRITLDVPITVDGKVFPAGTRLTVDKNLNWIAVSSWE